MVVKNTNQERLSLCPKDVFVLHGRTKAKVADQSQKIQSGSICQIRFGVILPLLMKLLMEMIIIPGLTLVTHSAVLLELSMLLIIKKALSTAETTYTQNWDGTAITGSKAITLANSLYFYVLPNDQTKAAREQEDPEEEGQAFVLDKNNFGIRIGNQW